MAEQASTEGGASPSLLDQARTAWDDNPRVRSGTAIGAAVLAFVLLTLSRVSPVQVLAIGLQAGAVSSLIALGIALVYKATRVLNFAQGELGTVPIFIAYVIFIGGDIAGEPRPDPDVAQFVIATLAALAVGAILAVLINVLVVQRLAEASQVIALVATVGVAFLLTGAELLVFRARARRFPRYVEGTPCLGPEAEAAGFGLCPLTVGNIQISWHTILVAIVLAAAAAILAVFFRTRWGVALLATAQEPFAAELQGVSVRRMATLAWAMAGVLGAIAGLLGAGNFNQVTPGYMTTTFLIPGIVGAILGGITSMPGAVIGGLIVGVAVALSNEFVLAYGLNAVLPGPPQIAQLLILLLVLLLRPRGLLGKEA